MSTSTPATTFLPQPQAKTQRRTRVMRSQSQWKDLLEEFDAGGLTRTAFCKKHRIATSSLYRWQQLLAEQSGGPLNLSMSPNRSLTPRRRLKLMRVAITGKWNWSWVLASC